MLDGWQGAFEIAVRREKAKYEKWHYVIVSVGACGQREQLDPWAYDPGTTSTYESDIVFKDGAFWRYPQGVQH